MAEASEGPSRRKVVSTPTQIRSRSETIGELEVDQLRVRRLRMSDASRAAVSLVCQNAPAILTEPAYHNALLTTYWMLSNPHKAAALVRAGSRSRTDTGSPPSRGRTCCATARRGMRAPVLAVADGALGFWGTASRRALSRRCT
jgi:hypothetical protein